MLVERDSEEDSVAEEFRSHDGRVFKFVHEDGSETAVKFPESERQVFNPLTGQVETVASDRGKYTVFASCSAGCFMSCGFCHLTIKKARHVRLGAAEVLANLKAAVSRAEDGGAGLGVKYVKLSWMGMGDAFAHPEMVEDVSLEFLSWAEGSGLALGLDGVDLGTVVPAVKNPGLKAFARLNESLKGMRQNPGNASPDQAAGKNFGKYAERSPFRMFFSLHSPDQEERDALVPGAMRLAEAVPMLRGFSDDSGVSLITHHLLLSGKNDGERAVERLARFMVDEMGGRELRLLRYNHCARSSETESAEFARLAGKLSELVPMLKIQISPGKEVSAACGQFLVRKFRSGGSAAG